MIKDLNKNSKYVVACSFGPDSMALLDMLIKDKYKVIVAHVNYHKRDVSNKEESDLRAYCKEKSVPIEVLDTEGQKCDKNFQEWAREIRYSFFKKIADKHDAKAVLVAHQEDDLIETFLMQQKRGGIVKYWGLAEKTTIFDVDIIRPLLGYTKQELIDYDEANNVPYSIDISNLSNAYERNKIRHSVVEKLSRKERDKILQQISEMNNVTQEPVKTSWSKQEFLKMSDQQIVQSISNHLSKHDHHVDLSTNFVLEIKKAIDSKKVFVRVPLTKKISLVKDYDSIYFSDLKIASNYCYKLDKNTIVDDELFLIDFTKGKEERSIGLNDYPLTIKPVDKKDVINLADYECVVRRLFIDWKMPHCYRDYWPGIYNKDGKLIYIPRYRKIFVDNHTSKFVIKFTNKF